LWSGVDYVVDPITGPGYSDIGAIPQTFNIHGKLSDSDGVPLSGTHSMNFSIYDVSTGGSAAWSDQLSITTDLDGVYDVILEAIDLNFSKQYFLGISVEGDVEMTPRMNLTSNPYAFMAQNVMIGGVIINDNFDATGYNITADYFMGDGSLLTNINASAVSYWEKTGMI